jgi:hypothetical protein
MKGAVFVLVLASLTGIAATIPPQQQTWSFPDTGFYGRATIQYRSQGVQVLVNYDYSQRNHNTQWLLVDLAIASSKWFVLHKDHIELRTPNGREIGVAPHATIIADRATLTKLLQNASVQRRPVISYFPERDSVERIRFQTLGSGTISPEATVNNDHVTSGPILFANPQGSWDAGTYRLEITNEVAKAALPITLD